MNRKYLIAGGLGALLIASTTVGLTGWQAEHRRVKALESLVTELQRKEKRSAVDRSISAQMEEIAFEQKTISDEQRENALQQTRVANEMRERSERERQNALLAERNAVASEKKALEASALAESQRQMAEHQRIQAEFAKRVADTLSYIALGRSLGSISTIQFQAGNEDIANMLSYAAYLYTSRYNGDIYTPAVFQSLMQASRSMTSWAEHTGAVMNLEYMPGKDNCLVSVSNYGEIRLTERKGSQLDTKVLFKNSAYDFRDVIIDQNTETIYAVSRTGHLVIIQNDQKTAKAVAKVVALDHIEHPMRLHDLNEKSLLVIGERSIGLVELKHNTLIQVRQLPFQVTFGSRKNKLPLLFDDKGRMHLVKGLDNISSEQLPVSGKVTAYCESKNTGVEAYGMNDGAIWLVYNNGKTQKLLGHQSRISKMKLNGRRLFSASYDGRVNLWITDKEKQEPMTLIDNSSWIMHFNFDSTKNTFWMGDVKGNLTAVNISVPEMVDQMKKKLKRNLTTDEWQYYIGKDIPYEPFINANGKEAGQ